MAVPATPHYGPDWVQFLRETRGMAQKVFQTRHDLYIMAGAGTMALEASMASALEPGDAVLMPCNGFFAERLVTVARGQGLTPVVIEAPAGDPILPAEVDAALQAHPEVKAVVLVHHETATCVLNPLEAIAEVVRVHDKLFIVDAVSSIGGVPVLVDEWGIDFCVSVANKALGTPPGLALVSISPQAWEAIDARQAPRGWYMDLKTWRWYAENWGDWHPTPVTMPVSNVYALHRSLCSMMDQGLEQRYAAYKAAARAVRRGLEALGFILLVKDDAYASPLTTAFYMRPGVDPAALQTALMEDAKVQVSVGIGALHDDILRVGHLGLARKRDYVVAFLLGVEDYLRSQEIAVSVGQSLVALEGLEV
jgi:alanine-glyoxylate transaminase/serine-glyoxylate transaminase/serine-pyruvate transaminase